MVKRGQWVVVLEGTATSRNIVTADTMEQALLEGIKLHSEQYGFNLTSHTVTRVEHETETHGTDVVVG